MKRWEILYDDAPQQLDIQTIISIILLNRGITDKKDIEQFLHPELKSVTCEKVGIDISQVNKAIQRIEESIEKEKTIVVFGDYDVDGICGTALLWEALYENYKKSVPYIPHRADEGYGLSIKGIDNVLAKHEDVNLIITVDNGIVAHEAVKYAQSKGIDVIVTDHHVKDEKLPPAYAVIHSTKLCGTSVAYLFVKEMKKGQKLNGKYLDLVALATVADLVPLTESNRALLFFGLKQLQTTKRCGLLELFSEAGIDQTHIGTYEIGHVIAPRLNATGRLSSAFDSLRLVCTKDSLRAKKLAHMLGQSNKDRQVLTQDLSSHALSMMAAESDTKKVLVVAHESYNQGVIGLIASKLVEKYYRPSLVISMGELHSKGSARSIKGVNIIEMIRSVSEHVVQAGGHPMAAGFTIETSKIELFRKALEEKALNVVTDSHLQRVISIDLELPWELISYSLYQEIQNLAPFGMGNPEPVFVTKGVYIQDVRTMGKDNSHYRLLLEQEGKILEAVAFNFASEMKLHVADYIDIAYTIDFDTWRGKNKICLKIRDIKFNDKN